MLFRSAILDGIRRGKIRMAFRRWTRPTVKSGGSLLSSAGLLAIRSVKVFPEARLTEALAKAAGYPSLTELRTELKRRSEGKLYRIDFERVGEDPRLKLRAKTRLSGSETLDLLARLERLDRSRSRPWTRRVLETLQAQPGVRAGDLIRNFPEYSDVLTFKTDVRKLKNLGLTISLGTGYKLSPRGRRILSRISTGV